jgi:hypothetical protein
MLTQYELQIGNRYIKVRSLAEASEIYCSARDKSGLGMNDMPDGVIWHGNVSTATISYNGKVWPLQISLSKPQPLYNPYA